MNASPKYRDLALIVLAAEANKTILHSQLAVMAAQGGDPKKAEFHQFHAERHALTAHEDAIKWWREGEERNLIGDAGSD